MDDALAAVGMLFMLFLVVATTAEQIIEAFRGFLEQLGFRDLKAGISVAEATKLSQEFLPAGGEAMAKVQALLVVAEDYPRRLKEKKDDIERMKTSLANVLGGGPNGGLAEDVGAGLTRLSMEVSAMVQDAERTRVWVLRLLSFAVCIAICQFMQFDALAIVIQSNPEMFGGMLKLHSLGADRTVAPVVWGILATALAASAGSSYWHDQLDRVRSLKSATAALKAAAG